MEIVRNFVKRATDSSVWDGTVRDSVKVECNATEWKIDGKVIPEASALYLMNFAMQSLQDAYAGAKSLDEAKGSLGKKYDQLLAGTIGTRESSAETEEQSVARDIFAKAAKVKYPNETKDEIAARVEKAMGNDAALLSIAQRVADEVNRRREERARKAAAKAAIADVEI